MAALLTKLRAPDFYERGNSQDYHYRPDIGMLLARAPEWRREHGILPCGADRNKVVLSVLGIDWNLDFTHKDGRLYVAGRSGTGGMDAAANFAEFIYANLGLITEFVPTMDSHVPQQVFFPTAHLTADDTYVQPNTVITAEAYQKGVYRPNPEMAVALDVSLAWLQKQFTYYCEELEKSGKYSLYIWPFHTMLGSDGHPLIGIVEEARLFHSFVRGAANLPEIKGGNPLTEHYSVFCPEVTITWDGQAIPGAQRNTRLLERLMKSDIVAIGGLASSHCVKESIADFLKWIRTQDPALAKKVYIMEDCTAPVVIPPAGIDFTDQADQALQEFRDAGMNVVRSTDPIETWPGVAAMYGV
jgi:nicotinamidase-related amidase